MKHTSLILGFCLLALMSFNKNGDININNGQNITVNVGGSHSSYGKSDCASHSGCPLQDFIVDSKTHVLLMLYLLDCWAKRKRTNKDGKKCKDAMHLDPQGTTGDKVRADKERGPTNPITIQPPKAK